MKYVLRSIFSKNVAIVYAEKCVSEFDVWKFYIGERVVCECNKNTVTSIEVIHPTEKDVKMAYNEIKGGANG